MATLLGMMKTLDVQSIQKLPLPKTQRDWDEFKRWLIIWTEQMTRIIELIQADAIITSTGDIAHIGDENTDGSWKFYKDSNNILRTQQRISGTWTDATFLASGA